MIRLWNKFRKMRWFGLRDWIGLAILWGVLTGLLAYEQWNSRKFHESFSTGKMFLRHNLSATFYFGHVAFDFESYRSAGDPMLNYRRTYHGRWPYDPEYPDPTRLKGDEWKFFHVDMHRIVDDDTMQASRMGISIHGGIRSTSGSEVPNEGADYLCMVMPIGHLMIPSGVMFFFSVFMARRQWKISRQTRRREKGLCAGCGYDLRTHKPGERCPECGKEIV